MTTPKSTPTDQKLLAEWFWIDRWMGSSAFLLPIEPRGLYREMLTQAWRRGCRLPNDHPAIMRAVGCTLQEWKRCWPVIAKYWQVDGDDLTNETQVVVYAEALAKHEGAKARGSLGGKARAQALAKLQAQLPAKQVAIGVDGGKPPSLSPSPIVCSSEHTQRSARVNGENPERTALGMRAGAFVDRYKAAHVRWRNGAAYVGKMHFDYSEAMILVEAYPDERLDKLTEMWLRTEVEGGDAFLDNGTRTIAKFRSRVSWCDERLREIGQ